MLRLLMYTVLSTLGAASVYGTHGLALAVAAGAGVFVTCLIVDGIIAASINGGMWG